MTSEEWQALPRFVHTRVKKPFSPVTAHPELKSTGLYKDVYKGDEIYLFETHSSKVFAKGYLIIKPLPVDFMADHLHDLEELPDQKTAIVIVPYKNLIILDELPIDPNFTEPSIKDFQSSTPADGKSLYEIQENDQDEKRIPPLPLIRLDDGELLDELEPSLTLLASHIYSLYTIGELELYEKLSELFDDLNTLTIKLKHCLYTKNEFKDLKIKISIILTNIPKLLSSKGYNKFSASYHTSQLKNDSAGYQVISARDTTTGNLYNYSSDDLSEINPPEIIAVNQLLSGLNPTFPLQNNNLPKLITPSNKSKFDKIPPSQILVDFKDVSGSSKLLPKGFTGLTVYMYLRTTKKRLTEPFAIHINASDGILLNRLNAALFRNVPGYEIDNNNRIYLVVSVVEHLNLAAYKSSAPADLTHIKKGVASGVTDISRVFSRHSGALKSGKSHQFTIKLFTSFLDDNPQNLGWGELIDRIITDSKVGLAVNPRTEKIILNIKEIKYEKFQSFDSSFIPIKPAFYDPLLADDRVYLKLGKFEILENSNSNNNNYTILKRKLISIQVKNKNNSSLKFSKATNEKPSSTWNFNSVHPRESIGEQIRIDGINNSDLSQIITLNLFINFIKISEIDLIITSKGQIMEYSSEHLITFKKNGVNLANLQISTEYFGSKFNIQPCLKQIMSWKSRFKLPQEEDSLITVLKQLNHQDMTQLIKSFDDLLVSLLQILENSIETKSEKLTDAVSYSIIHLLDVMIVRQDQYTYLFHDFIDKGYDLPKIGAEIISGIFKTFNKVEEKWNFVGRSTCRVLPLIIKIAICSIDLTEIDFFKNCWNNLYQSLKLFFTLGDELFISDQLEIIQNLDIIFKDLREIFKDDEIIRYSIGLINNISTKGISNDDPNKIITATKTKEIRIFIEKLLLINRLINSWIFKPEELSKNLVQLFYHVINWSIEAYNTPYIEVEIARLANSCLISISRYCWRIIKLNLKELNIFTRNFARLLPTITKIFIKVHQFCVKNNLFQKKRSYTTIFQQEYPFNELIVDSVINETLYIELLVELGTIYASITKITKIFQLENFEELIRICEADEIFNSSNLFIKSFTKDDIILVVQTNNLLIQSKFFDHGKWLSLYSVYIESCLTTFELIKPIMISRFISEFDKYLWIKYIKSIISIGISAPASIEHLSEIPRSTSFKILGGDIRKRCSNLLDCLWGEIQKLDNFQLQFTHDENSFIESLIIYCLQRDSSCQITGVKILWSLFDKDLSNVEIIEKHCYLGIDRFYRLDRYKPGEYEILNFINRFKMCVKLSDEEKISKISTFIDNLSNFLDLTINYTLIPKGEEFDDERIFQQVEILKNFNKVGITKRFQLTIWEIYQINLKKNKYVQAALCLELISENYTWDLNKVEGGLNEKLPQQTSFERREYLFKEIASNLIKGEKFEKAILIYKELSEAYDNISYNLAGLSFVHDKLGQLYNMLKTKERPTPTYFKVSFIGTGFPKTIRDKTFIYEGAPFEHITSIHNRLLRLYVGGKIINENDDVGEDVHGRFLKISIVKPSLKSSNLKLNTLERLYMENKQLNKFSASKRTTKSTSVLDLWVEKVEYVTRDTFPTLMNRSEVISTKVDELSPIENAIKTINDKIQELINFESYIKDGDKSKLPALRMVVSGTVDSPVNGGIGQYRDFFSVDIQNDEALVQKLQDLFDQLSLVIYQCLRLHSRLVSDDFIDTNNLLIEMFKKNFAKEIERNDIKFEELHQLQRTQSNSSASDTLRTTETNSSDKSKNSGLLKRLRNKTSNH